MDPFLPSAYFVCMVLYMYVHTQMPHTYIYIYIYISHGKPVTTSSKHVFLYMLVTCLTYRHFQLATYTHFTHNDICSLKSSETMRTNKHDGWTLLNILSCLCLSACLSIRLSAPFWAGWFINYNIAWDPILKASGWCGSVVTLELINTIDQWSDRW